MDDVTEAKNLRIIQLKAENFKRLRAVEIKPAADGSLVMITGRNGQGKSSVLDAILAALGGARSLPDVPIRSGARESKITIDLGEIIVTRVIKSKGAPELHVKAATGTQYQSPQTLLDALIGKISFDPLAFMRLDRQKQVKQLQAVVNLGFDPAAMDAEKSALDGQFTEAGREVDKYRGALAAMASPTVPPGTAEVSATEMIENFRVASGLHGNFHHAQRSIDALQERDTNLSGKQETLRAEIAGLTAKLEALAVERSRLGETLREELAALETLAADLPDLDAIQGEMNTVESRNRAIREAQAYYTTEQQLEAAEAERARLKAARETHDVRRDELIGQAQMPVDGLGFDSDGLTLNGIPLEQASASEQLRVSLAIAMAANPKLRVITIRDGSLLDSQALAAIEQQAADQGYQLWVEQVDESGETGVVIEDGLVVADHTAETAEAAGVTEVEL